MESYLVTVEDRDGCLVDAVQSGSYTTALRAVIAWMGGRRRHTFTVQVQRSVTA